MTKPAVLFGGPSPEHDISILTGLQAARALVDSGQEIEAIYWSKSGEWFLVDSDLEATDFSDGVPSRSKSLRFEAEPGGGFFAKKRPLEISAVLNCCHGGPGEDGREVRPGRRGGRRGRGRHRRARLRPARPGRTRWRASARAIS